MHDVLAALKDAGFDPEALQLESVIGTCYVFTIKGGTK